MPLLTVPSPTTSLSFLGLLIYASVIFHRHRKGTLQGAYVPANANPQFQGFVQPAGYPPAGYPQTAYQPADYQQMPYQHQGYQQTAYQPTAYQPGGNPSPNATYSDPQYKSPTYDYPQAVQQVPAGIYEMDNRTGHVS